MKCSQISTFIILPAQARAKTGCQAQMGQQAQFWPQNFHLDKGYPSLGNESIGEMGQTTAQGDAGNINVRQRTFMLL